MKLNAPKQVTWIIAVIVGVLGIIGHETSLGFATVYSHWLLVVGFVLLALATMVKDL